MPTGSHEENNALPLISVNIVGCKQHFSFLGNVLELGFLCLETKQDNRTSNMFQFLTRLSSIESQPKKVDVVVVFIDGLVFVVDVVLSVVVVIVVHVVDDPRNLSLKFGLNGVKSR